MEWDGKWMGWSENGPLLVFQAHIASQDVTVFTVLPHPGMSSPMIQHETIHEARIYQRTDPWEKNETTEQEKDT